MSEVRKTILELHELAVTVLVRHGTSEVNARAVADALLAAEADGLKGHGLSRVPSYAAQSASGKVNGHATPTAVEVADASIRIDARDGFAYPALKLAVKELCRRAPRSGVAVAAVTNSHHFGTAGYHVERLAEQGLVGLLFGNSPKAIAPWGGTKGLFGTNPIAFAAPRRDAPPLLIDLSLSKVARGKVMVARQKGESIPEGWALDENGRPTTDPDAAIKGTMVPMGDAKGAALVLMVEILSAALTSAHFGFEASSFFSAEGDPPRVGQLLLAFAPGPLSDGAFSDRLETLLGAVLEQDGTRLPGARRLQSRAVSQRDGIDVPEVLYRQLIELSGVEEPTATAALVQDAPMPR
jgi:(2R)-3-sulfolactate dehydrogenase (NADP+)